MLRKKEDMKEWQAEALPIDPPAEVPMEEIQEVKPKEEVAIEPVLKEEAPKKAPAKKPAAKKTTSKKTTK